jgi:transcriptional regulator with XRE-family HTH domain
LITYLKILRTYAKLSQKAIAKGCRISDTTISLHEKKNLDFSKEFTINIAKFLQRQGKNFDPDAFVVNNGYLPEDFYRARKEKPEELAKELAKFLKQFNEKYYDE